MFKKKKDTDKIPEKKFWKKLRNYARKAGAKVVYASLLMYYAFRRKETPAWAKTAILGALAYFLSPIDFIPDLTPLLGFTDDFAVMLTGLITIGTYVDDNVKRQARAKMDKWFDEEATLIAMEDVDKKMERK
jgi:uncharacterized membrane protein YkvA (DUF1232 family)